MYPHKLYALCSEKWWKFPKIHPKESKYNTMNQILPIFKPWSKVQVSVDFSLPFEIQTKHSWKEKENKLILSSLFIFLLAGTPYAGGFFRVKLILGKDFPQTPPKAYFLTKIFHPNVAANGEICVNTLKKDWKPDLGIKHILLVSPFNWSIQSHQGMNMVLTVFCS